MSGSVRSGDKADKELAGYNYQLLTLSVANPEALPPAEAEAAERITEVFNARMSGMMEEFEAYGAALGRDAKNAYKGGYLHEAYYDEVTASGAVVGEVVSIRIDRSSYTGGAHPSGYASGCLFDLAAGQFIPDPSQLADDPAVFQEAAGDALIAAADSLSREQRDLYWDNYRNIIREWNNGAVYFSQVGMTVIFSAYELGPYVLGPVELTLGWEALAELMGPGGLARLGADLPGLAG